MSYQTDEHLKSFLDTNQLFREQMCLAILNLDKRFSDIKPRHPRGGPDKGRDIEAVYKQTMRCFCAVGFINQANDSVEQKRTITQKFTDDLFNSKKEELPEVFVFFTNLNFSITEKEVLITKSQESGVLYCEIFDRERIRIILDSADGFSIRYQYLNIPLSEAEQASFFTKWGDDIQGVISTGFQKMEESIKRMIFLQESMFVIDNLYFVFKLNRKYNGNEIGHFRVFCRIHLIEHKHNITSVVVGLTDKANRMSNNILESNKDKPGITNGMSGGQWDEIINSEFKEETDNYSLYSCKSTMSSIGYEEIESLVLTYSNGDLIRFGPCLTIHDIDKSDFLIEISENLCDKIKQIDLYGNEYLLGSFDCSNFGFSDVNELPDYPVPFTENELSCLWKRVFDKNGFIFRLNFSDKTPKRIVSYN